MKKVLSILAIVSLAFLAQGQAQDFTAPQKLYWGAGGGFNKIGTPLEGGDSSVMNFRLIGGYKTNENISLELGFFMTPMFYLSKRKSSYSSEHKAAYGGLEYSTILRPSVSTGYNNAFVTIGSGLVTGGMFGAGYDFKSVIPSQEGIDIRAAVTFVNAIGYSNKATNFGATLIKPF